MNGRKKMPKFHLGLKVFMNPTGYLTPQESMFQISNQSVKPFNLEIGEHRDIESHNYYIDKKLE